MEIQTDAVVNVARIYERVKYRNTGEARLVLGKKNPEKGVNFKHLKEFCETCVWNNILPNFYFESMYDGNKKIIPTKPECKFINNKANLHYYMIWIKNHCADLKDVVKSIEKTDENIKMFISDNHIYTNDPGSEPDPKNFTKINSLGRLYPDWVFMLKLGLISPFFLLTDKSLMRFSQFIVGDVENRINMYKYLYKQYNKDGVLAKALNKKFSKYIIAPD